MKVQNLVVVVSELLSFLLFESILATSSLRESPAERISSLPLRRHNNRP